MYQNGINRVACRCLKFGFNYGCLETRLVFCSFVLYICGLLLDIEYFFHFAVIENLLIHVSRNKK